MPVSHAKLTLTVKDYTDENSSTDFRGTVFTAANHDAQVTLQTNLATAVTNLIVGNIIQTKRQANVIYGSVVPPADVNAQRETKWIVSYQDDVTFDKHSTEIPCADLSLLSNNSEFLVLADTEAAAFVTAFEAYVLSPAGNAVTVLSIKHTGRNL